MRRPLFLFPGESCPAGAPAGGLLPCLHGGQALRLQHGHILPVPEPFPFQQQQVGAVVAEKAPGTGSIPLPFRRIFPRRKLQNGTVLPEISDLFREFAELPDGFAVRADQPAQKRGSVVYRLHETVFSFLIFCTECAIL